MKKVVFLFMVAVAIYLIGCSSAPWDNNRVDIQNLAAGILFNFRDSVYTVDASTSISIKNIPNGTYVYATTYSLPPGAKSVTMKGGSGSLVFQRGDSRYQFLYSGTIADSVYTVGPTISGTDNGLTITQ
ncbi:MAG: hypothetical protein PHC61_12615 [Chitinivibrionales bacterium]|nr:hypothetical protein [Chitinivibrionales bacterium]